MAYKKEAIQTVEFNPEMKYPIYHMEQRAYQTFLDILKIRNGNMKAALFGVWLTGMNDCREIFEAKESLPIEIIEIEGNDFPIG